jgi:hypothetical protein
MTVRRLIHEENGAVALMVALAFPFFIAFMALVLTAGDWWVHKRHLQTQVDAAALASAQGFGFPCAGSITRVSAAVADWGGTKNPQVENTQSNVHFVVNKPTYFAGGTPDDTPDADPCNSKMIDVKATETGLKGPIGVGLVPNINAHARVSFFQAASISGNMPIAVPEPAPKNVHAFFVDESTGTTFAQTDLVKNGTDGNGNAIWDNAGTPLNVTVGSKDRIGVRIALSGQSSTTCGQALVNCYDAGSANGLDFIRGWNDNGTGTQTANQPKARSVTLSSSTCPDPYFSTAATTCNVAVRATVDFGTGSTDPRPLTSPGVGALLRAVVGGNTYDMSYGGAGVWTSGESIPVTPGSGPISVNLEWAEQMGSITGLGNCSTNAFKNSNNCKGTITNVQRTFGGSTARSGPIQLVQILQGGIAGANSLRQCDDTNSSCTYPLVVRLSVKGTLEVARTTNDPLTTLRSGDNNQPGTIDCDPAISTLRDEIAQGCAPSYAPNTGTACPNSTSALWSSAQPWTCVALTTGGSVNQIPAGLNMRILGSAAATSCTHPNLYIQTFGAWGPDDPRVVQLLLAPFGSFSGTGSGTVPVIGFATFYITGWSGSGGGFNNPCTGAGDDPTSGSGDIVGHFISYVQTTGNSTPSTSPCDAESLTTCLSVLTR